MKKILYIIGILLVALVVLVGIINFFPTKSIKEIEEMQTTFIETGFTETLQNDFLEYTKLYVEALNNQVEPNLDFERELERNLELSTLNDELSTKFSLFQERIEAKDVTTETAKELKGLSLEIIDEVDSLLLFTNPSTRDGLYYDKSTIDLSNTFLENINVKFEEFLTILNEYFK